MLQILSSDERTKIHQTGLRILREIGIRVRSKIVYDMLLEAGAESDKDDAVRIYLPEKMVEKYFAVCPKQFAIRNREGKETIVKSNGASLFYTANATQYLRGTERKAVEVGVNDNLLQVGSNQ